MNRLRIVLALAVAGGIAARPAVAADVTAAARAFAERWETSLHAYQEQSKRITDEKIPLLRQIKDLEDENLRLRQSVQSMQQATAEDNRSFDALRNRLESAKAQSEFAGRFLREYLDSFESRLSTAEDQLYKEDLTGLRLALEQPGVSQEARFGHELAALEIGVRRAANAVGGHVFEGRAITPEGLVKTGAVHVVGPSAYFSDIKAGGAAAGILGFHPGTIEPALVALSEPHAREIREFFRQGGGALPFDASLGSALTLETANVRLGEHLAQGGPVGYTILLLGVIAAALVLVKFFDLRRFRSVGAPELQAILRAARARDEPGALALVRKITGPAGEMMELGVRNVRANIVLLEELMLSVILRRRPEAERFLPFLAITVVAAPLLGLLGTVVGMIRTFALITVFGAGDPRALSSGISEALVTTELGLMVAIPTLIAHSVLLRMIRNRSGDLERVAFEFVKNLSLEGPPADAR